jgi:hypothetical protein
LPDAGAGPVLIHIGYHRTGSSWLQKHFFTHRKSGFEWIGKSQDDHPVRRVITMRWSEFDPQRMRALFDPYLAAARSNGKIPVVSFERLSGHACSGGFDSVAIAERLRAVFPEGRVLIVVREQEAAIISNYKRYVRAGGPERLRDFLMPPQTTNLRVPLFDFRHFEYHHLVRTYQQLFGEDQVLTLAYEQFARDGQLFVRSIGEFAGLTLGPRMVRNLPYATKEQETFSPKALIVMRPLNHFVRSEVNTAPTLDLQRHQTIKHLAKSRLLDFLVPKILASRSEAKLRRVTSDLVGDRYADSNRATAALTGIDLGGYGYAV